MSDSNFKLINAYNRDRTYVEISQFIDGQHVCFDQVPFNKAYKYVEAFRAIRAHGILHCDINNENFLLTKDKVYVLDLASQR